MLQHGWISKHDTIWKKPETEGRIISYDSTMWKIQIGKSINRIQTEMPEAGGGKNEDYLKDIVSFPSHEKVWNRFEMR